MDIMDTALPADFGTWLLDMGESSNRSPLINPSSTDKSFEEWFVTNGGYLNSHIELSSNSTSGNCMRVKPDHAVPATSIIVSCPHILALSWPSARKFHYSEVPVPQCSQHVATRFFLMKQRLLAESSPWWPYIRLLPQSFNTPLYYDSEDMTWIRGTNLGRARQVREEAWRDEYGEALKTLFPVESHDKHEKIWTWSVLTVFGVSMLRDADFGKGAFSMGSDNHDLSRVSWSCRLQSS